MRHSEALGATKRKAGQRKGFSHFEPRAIAGIRAIKGQNYGIFSTRGLAPGESIRVFPLSNWTELDVWQYIAMENIPVVPLYFAKERPVVSAAEPGSWSMTNGCRLTRESDHRCAASASVPSDVIR